jgi:hypothetical protein
MVQAVRRRPWRPGLLHGSVRVGFVVKKMALGQVFVRFLWFFPVNIIPPWLSILIRYLGDVRSSET